jgi:hypothetical protein
VVVIFTHYNVTVIVFLYLLLQTNVLKSLAPKIANIVAHHKDDPLMYKRNLLKVEIYFDNFNLVTIQELVAYPVRCSFSVFCLTEAFILLYYLDNTEFRLQDVTRLWLMFPAEISFNITTCLIMRDRITCKN